MTGECRFCNQSHALAGWLGRTEIFQGAACFMHRLMDTQEDWPGQSEFVPEWRSVAELFSAYYAKHETCTGYNLHVVIDDTNVDDRCINWTRGWCDKDDDADGAMLMGLLIQMPMADRVLISRKVGGKDGTVLRDDWRPVGVEI